MSRNKTLALYTLVILDLTLSANQLLSTHQLSIDISVLNFLDCTKIKKKTKSETNVQLENNSFQGYFIYIDL